MKQSVYVETTVVSYLVAKRSKDVVTAGHQEATIEWWDKRRTYYELFISPEVLREASLGDGIYAAKRLGALQGIPVLAPSEAAERLARELLERKALPAKAASDALHLAYAVCYGQKYLATWNFRHIANGATMAMARDIMILSGYQIPVICTPEQL